MRARGGWPTRAARGLLCGSACLLLGAVSHVVAGGRLPGAGVLALLFLALSVQGALLFGGRRRRFDVVTLVLGSTQFALHGAFHFLSEAPGGAQHSGMPAGHEHPMTGHSGGHVMDAGMTLAHGAATLGTALCVIHGERVLRRLAALVVPRVALRPLPSLPCLPRLRPAPPVVARIRFGALLARSRHRRGPPSAAVA
ncbi:hypothetical protein [Streptomyces sp. ScaeMP-e48]|uniref:hypothetical protein n=1 Tax=Streptomyces sp. ScaeMP-e48 TaxID=1100823 RepID=UPI001F4EC464|nr:hypothetical protein [Streptomyces sp. ScaeMP-e48]